jgi:hypothetical protein
MLSMTVYSIGLRCGGGVLGGGPPKTPPHRHIFIVMGCHSEATLKRKFEHNRNMTGIKYPGRAIIFLSSFAS